MVLILIENFQNFILNRIIVLGSLGSKIKPNKSGSRHGGGGGLILKGSLFLKLEKRRYLIINTIIVSCCSFQLEFGHKIFWLFCWRASL